MGLQCLRKLKAASERLAVTRLTMSKAQSECDPRAANLKFTKAEVRIAVEAWKEAKKECEGTSRTKRSFSYCQRAVRMMGQLPVAGVFGVINLLTHQN